jgi:hypothetical protein
MNLFERKLAGRFAVKLLDINQVESAPDFLGTGLADALITRLSAVRNFAVRPTSSVLRYGRTLIRYEQDVSSALHSCWTDASEDRQNAFASPFNS